jgi:membrane protease YdiL (CAAX protease family)
VSRGAIGRELTLVYAGVALLTWVITHIEGALADALGQLVLSGVFLFGALALARRDPRGATHYGSDLAGVLEPRPEDPGVLHALWRGLPSMLRELGFALIVVAVVFPPFIGLFALWHGVHQPFSWQPPAHPFDFALTQLLVVAIPEEALFRGYFQTRLEDLFPARPLSERAAQDPRRPLLATRISAPALMLQAGLFAVLHFLVGFVPGRLAVFFPGLLFGFIRARRGGIGAAVWFHALSNALSEILTRGWL